MPSIEQLNKLLAIEPNDIFLNFGLAMEYAKSNQPEEAIRQFQKVLELDPNYYTAYFQWAKLLINTDCRPEAREVLKKGIRTAENCNDRHAKTEMRELLDAIAES